MLETLSFDGILMDCQMPVMDGYTATAKIRAQAGFKTLPIIAMTANVMTGDVEKSLEAGMNDHIGKPFKFNEMLVTLARWITPRRETAPIVSETGQPSALQPVLNNLPGIDVNAGLATVQGDTRLYRKLLIQFRDRYRDFETRFEAAIAGNSSGDPDQATRYAHSLKGVAGSIGAKAVEKTAGELEAACRRNGTEQASVLLAHVVDTLSPVLAGLQDLDEEDDLYDMNAFSPNDNVHSGQLDMHLGQLRELLEASDTEVFDILRRLRAFPELREQREMMQRLLKTVEAFEFEDALEVLDELNQSIRKRHQQKTAG